MNKLFNFNEADSYIHNLSGLSKLLAFLALTFTVMLTYDPRVIGIILVFSIFVFKLSGIKLKQLKVLFIYISIFFFFNFVLTYLFAPTYGVELYGTKHILFTITPRYIVTQEQLFYQLTKLAKYAATIPFGILFILTTHPSEFAASLNKIGVSYKVCYVLSLTLRYLPDIQSEYMIISKSQQARGLDLSKKTKLLYRVREYIKMILPLVFSTLDRVDNIANAMDLRGFSKHKKRTWYNSRKLSKNDIFAITISVSIFLTSLGISTFINQSRFWNPFI